MGLGSLPLTSPTTFPSNSRLVQNSPNHRLNNKSFQFSVSAKQEKEEAKKSKTSLFTSVTDALDFAQVRSAEDAQLLEDARETTRSGERMSREQVIHTYISISISIFISMLLKISTFFFCLIFFYSVLNLVSYL